MSTDRFTRACARVVTGVLAADSAFHVYWATGATWPAADDRALSLAVMGFEVPFTTRILVPLAVVLALAATAVHIRHSRGRAGFVGGLTHLVTLGVAAGTAAQVPLRLAWALGLGSDTATPFYWLNLFVYLPLCVALAYGAYRVATDGLSRKALVRTVIAAPMAVVLLAGGTAWTFAWEPQLKALSATHTVYVVDMPGQGYTTLHDEDFAYDLPTMDTVIGTFLDAVGLQTTALAGDIRGAAAGHCPSPRTIHRASPSWSWSPLPASTNWSRTEPLLGGTLQPTLILWGDRDSVLPVEQAARFAELMPNDETKSPQAADTPSPSIALTR